MSPRSRWKKKKLRAAPGSAPGTMVAREEPSPTVVTRVVYNGSKIQEKVFEDPLKVDSLSKAEMVTWINIEGLSNLDIVGHFGDLAQLHRLSVEDILTYQRPKIESHQKTTLLTLHAYTPEGHQEQLTLVLGKGFLLTFQEGIPGDCFDPLRQRLREKVGIVRTRGVDYLAYALIDAIIDSYFPVVERSGDFLEELEDQVLGLQRSGSELVDDIRRARREISSLHRNLRP